jgi:hypothetical protein
VPLSLETLGTASTSLPSKKLSVPFLRVSVDLRTCSGDPRSLETSTYIRDAYRNGGEGVDSVPDSGYSLIRL